VQPYQVSPTAIAPRAFQRPIQVAYRIRYFPMEGIDSYVAGRWMVVYNTAREVFPVGIPSEASVERPDEVINRNRRFRMHWVLDSMEFGTAMVAYRIRRVTHWFPYTGSAFSFGLEARINPHPIAPASWDQDADRHAAPYVEERFTIIHPWGKLPAWPPLSNGTVVANRNRSSINNVRWGREVWLTCRVRNNRPTCRLQSLRLSINLQGRRFGNSSNFLRDAFTHAYKPTISAITKHVRRCEQAYC
jgi:hypothetical protein